MSDCGPAWAGLAAATLFLVLPLGVPLLGAAVVAWRRASAKAVGAAVAVAFVGAVAWTFVVLDHPADPRWLPALFLPALVAGALALLRPSRGARLALVATALVPSVGGLAYGVALRLAYQPCVW